MVSSPLLGKTVCNINPLCLLLVIIIVTVGQNTSQTPEFIALTDVQKECGE